MEQMEIVKQDIEAAKKLMLYKKEHNGFFEKYDTSFLFGTENQEGINNVINYKGKDVFTIASSGEQYLGVRYYGAKKVDIYDINRLTKYITSLRIGSFLALEYDEFIRFTFPYVEEHFNPNFWNVEDITRVILNLPPDIAYFWANLLPLLEEKKYGDLIALRNNARNKEQIVRGMPFYANEEEYNKLKDILKKYGFPNFYELDISTFDGTFDTAYNIVYLSNIIEGIICYIVKNEIFCGHLLENITERSELQRILNNLYPLLKKNGIFLVDYRPNVTRYDATDYMFNNSYFNVHEVPSKFCLDNRAEKDLILTYKPQEKDLFWNN